MRALGLALVMTSLLAPSALAQQDRAVVDAAYSRIEMKIVEWTRTPAAQRQKVSEELFALSGGFLDQHLRGATQEQLLKSGKLWFMLAERLHAPERAVMNRIAAIKALP